MQLSLDLTAFEAAIHRLEAGLTAAVGDALTELAELAAKAAQSEFASGPLRDSIKAYSVSVLHKGVLANQPYASWVEYGNGPPGSRIYPKVAKFLHFHWKGKEFFCRSVKASKPRPYMAKASMLASRDGESIVAAHINRYLGSV